MLWLGFWQLDKSELQQQREADFLQADATPLSLREVTDVAALRYRNVALSGYFDPKRHFLIDNIVRNSRNGFYVITPFYADEGPLLLVNRGWIPQTPRREPIGDLAVSDTPLTIKGRIGGLPAGGIRLGEREMAGEEWPRVLQFPETSDIELQLGQPVLDWVLLADPAIASGFERQWEPGGLPPERHLGYAVQWFAMSLALTILMGWAAWQSRIRNRKNK